MIPLPAWVDSELWDDYVRQRKADKKAMTPRSAAGRLKRLVALRDAGHDPNACIEEALNAHWLDFYAPRDKTIERANGKAADTTRDYLEAEKARPVVAPPANIRALVRGIGRAA